MSCLNPFWWIVPPAVIVSAKLQKSATVFCHYFSTQNFCGKLISSQNNTEAISDLHGDSIPRIQILRCRFHPTLLRKSEYNMRQNQRMR